MSTFYDITPHYLWHYLHCIHDFTPTIAKMASNVCASSQRLRWWSQTNCMTSYPLYVCHLMHSTKRHIHSLWLHTIVVITLHPLHSWHNTTYIWHHTHGNTNVLSAISQNISNTTLLYLCHQTQGISYTKPTLCMTSHRLYMWHRIK